MARAPMSADRIEDLPPEKEPVESTAPPTRKLRRSVLDDFADLVGKLPDAEVAQQAGVTREAVRIYRVRRGIPSATQQATVPAEPTTPVEPRPGERTSPAKRTSRARRSRPRGASALDAHRDKVGVLSDSEVAKLAGVTPSAVRMFRTRRGIPASRPRGAVQPVVSPAASYAPTAAVGHSCWRIMLSSGESAFVIAPSVERAAARAEAVLGQRAVALERVGDAIV